ncbi:MAG: glycosyltransferase, partial [Deltaproteobacteria bacterium]|nr:glycosyltransferase [Deltaproteobacteria bacterium]
MTSTPLKISDISIIIPTLNEEENIGLLPKSLNSAVGEVLVVDGGSNDKTIPLAKEKGFRVLSAPPGRAAQLNHGAAASRGSLL